MVGPEDAEEREAAEQRRRMVDAQIKGRGVAQQRVLSAMAHVPRHLFIAKKLRWAAYHDEPLPIGAGQTISQPYMVARMTELLELEPDSRVLEVGTGSGYQAAVLAEIAGEVWTIERHADLAADADRRLRDLGYRNVHVVVGDGSLGLPDLAPFDAVMVTAAAPAVPPSLLDQLAPGGRLVIPVGGTHSQRLRLVRRGPEGFRGTDVLDCRFVPLIGEQGHPSGETRGPSPSPAPSDEGPDDGSTKRVRLLIEGRVQGVWFRESTRLEAEACGVFGWVRNLPDGRVEAVFEGVPAAVDGLIEWARHGPDRALVTGVSIERERPVGETGFRVAG